jgi:hypothetical protein
MFSHEMPAKKTLFLTVRQFFGPSGATIASRSFIPISALAMCSSIARRILMPDRYRFDVSDPKGGLLARPRNWNISLPAEYPQHVSVLQAFAVVGGIISSPRS